MMVVDLDEFDPDLGNGGKKEDLEDDWWAETLEELSMGEEGVTENDVRSSRRGSSRILSTVALQEQALRFPQMLLQAREVGDLNRMQEIIEQSFSPDCTFKADSLDEPVVGRECILKLVAATLDIFPDSVATFKRSFINKHEEVVSEISVVGTRTDSLLPSRPVNGSELLFRPEDVAARDFHKRLLSKSMKRALSRVELKRIREIDDKIMRQKALAQMEMRVFCKMRLKLEPSPDPASSPPRLIVVHAEHAWKLTMLSACPVPAA